MGEEPAPWPRATSIQKCFRTPDIEIIGTDTYHCTFFEMLGNFSFGDYFKAEAIPMAWELLTEVFGLDGDRLWVTVHESDDEAEQIWIDKVGVRPERDPAHGRRGQLLGDGRHRPLRPRLGDLHRQGRGLRRTTAGPSTAATSASSRSGTSSSCSTTATPTARLTDLPRKNIDTGAGLERILPVLQGVDSMFDTDLFAADHRRGGLHHRHRLRDRRADRRRAARPGRPRPGHVHAGGRRRAAGQRGSGLRAAPGRAPRRPGRPARSASTSPSGRALVEAATEVLGDGLARPCVAQHDLIVNVVAREEAGFDRTLRAGLSRLEEAFATGTKVLAGDVAFTLHDTHGFPVELTEELARDAGVEVDRAGFDAAMAEQRERARAAARVRPGGRRGGLPALLEAEGPTAFVGPRAGGLRGAGPGRGRARAAWTASDAGVERRDLLGPHAVLRRGRWPGGRHRDHRDRDGHRRRSTTPCYAVPGLVAHRATVDRRGAWPARTRWPPSTGSAARPSGATTPRPTSCTPRCGRCWATTCASRGRWWRPTTCASTSRTTSQPTPRGARRGASRWPTPPCSTDAGSRRPRPHARRPSRWAPSPSSATSTARRCAWCGPGPTSLEFCGGTHVDSLGQIGPITLRLGGLHRLEHAAALRRHRAASRSTRAVERERLVQAAAELLRTEPDELLAAIGRLIERQREAEQGAGAAAPAVERGGGRRRWPRRPRPTAGVVVARRDEVEPDALRTLAQAVLRHDGVRAVVLGGLARRRRRWPSPAATGRDARRHRARADAGRDGRRRAAAGRPSWRWPAARTRRGIEAALAEARRLLSA